MSMRGCVESANGFMQLPREELMHFRVRRSGSCQNPQLFYARISSFLSFFTVRILFSLSILSLSPLQLFLFCFFRLHLAERAKPALISSSLLNLQSSNGSPFTLGHSVVCQSRSSHTVRTSQKELVARNM